MPPQQLSIPGVDVAMPIAATGVQADGQMELPDDPSVIGWYKFGASPGDQRGSTVLGGHVDSIDQGIGPLARLASVEVGDRLVVTAADDKPVRYEVVSVERITKAALPVDVLFRPEGPHQLAVVTCGGSYDPDAGGYEDNIVVLARPVTR
jgi:LPXTG-site transpeptidase (sortase) family protein